MKIDDWVEAYRTAWVEADSDAVRALFALDGTYRSNIFEPPHLGREGVEEYWTSVTSAQSEVNVRMGEPFVDGDRVTVEFWTVMKVGGDDLTLGGCLLLNFNSDGLCTDLREYWAALPGRIEPPEEWGT